MLKSHNETNFFVRFMPRKKRQSNDINRTSTKINQRIQGSLIYSNKLYIKRDRVGNITGIRIPCSILQATLTDASGHLGSRPKSILTIPIRRWRSFKTIKTLRVELARLYFKLGIYSVLLHRKRFIYLIGTTAVSVYRKILYVGVEQLLESQIFHSFGNILLTVIQFHKTTKLERLRSRNTIFLFHFLT